MKKRIFAAALSVVTLLTSCTPNDPGTTEDNDTETVETAPATEEITDTEPVGTDAPDDNVFPEGENIEIGIFWEPPHDFTTPEQYDWIRDANVTFIEVTNRDGAINREEAQKQIKLASERGIKIVYSPAADGKNLAAMTAEQITEYARELGKDPTVVGIHVVDEPAQPWNYAGICAAIKKGGLMPRLNMLPYFATWVFENYQTFIEDTIIAAGKENYGYLSYDQYPFPYNGGDPDMFYNLDLIRRIGLKYDVPTAFYVQSIGEGGNFRRTNGGEIRYHTSAGLAYGLKSLTYCTWWTTGFCAEKDYAIISPYGEKTDIYDDVASVNRDILTVGPLLRRLDAVEIYHTSGKEAGITRCTKDDVPVYGSTSGKYGFIISLMKDRENGREYVMIVNKNYKKSVSAHFAVSDGVSALYDCTGGEYVPLDFKDGTDLSFEAGGFRLLALGGKDRVIKQPEQPDNKALGKAPFADRVEPGAGYYAACLTDGDRAGEGDTARGYRSSRNTGAFGVDLGSVTAVNRVDLYPAGTEYTRGETFPQKFTVETSDDGADWTVRYEYDDPDGARKAIPVIRFDRTECRYVRINVLKGCPEGGFAVAEIEVYDDGGSLPVPDNSLYYKDASDVKKGDNLALGKSVTVLSELGGDWSRTKLTDGDRGSCYSSALNRHATADGEEWITVDLGAVLAFNEVDVYPRPGGAYFPLKLRVLTSDDGKNFTEIFDCDDVKLPEEGEPFVCTVDTVKSRYVRVLGYSLTDFPGINDGHLFQAAEIEIYEK